MGVLANKIKRDPLHLNRNQLRVLAQLMTGCAPKRVHQTTLQSLERRGMVEGPMSTITVRGEEALARFVLQSTEGDPETYAERLASIVEEMHDDVRALTAAVRRMP